MTKLTRSVSVEELAEHVRQLSEAFGVPIVFTKEVGDNGYTMALQVPGSPLRCSVITQPVTDECTYAIALHELGHAVEPLGVIQTDELAKEELAWNWARHYALIWTTAMDQVEHIGMQSHRLKVQHEEQLRKRQEVLDAKRSQELRGFVRRLKL
jgi:hypothetical protein